MIHEISNDDDHMGHEDCNDADNGDIDVIAFGEEPTFIEELGTFTANLVKKIDLLSEGNGLHGVKHVFRTLY